MLPLIWLLMKINGATIVLQNLGLFEFANYYNVDSLVITDAQIREKIMEILMNIKSMLPQANEELINDGKIQIGQKFITVSMKVVKSSKFN